MKQFAKIFSNESHMWTCKKNQIFSTFLFYCSNPPPPHSLLFFIFILPNHCHNSGISNLFLQQTNQHILKHFSAVFKLIVAGRKQTFQILHNSFNKFVDTITVKPLFKCKYVFCKRYFCWNTVCSHIYSHGCILAL